MKKWTLLLLFCIVAMGAQAQFEKRTKYIGASLSGLGLSYSSNERFRMGIDAEAGYFIADCVLLKGNIGYEHTRYTDDVRIGATAILTSYIGYTGVCVASPLAWAGACALLIPVYYHMMRSLQASDVSSSLYQMPKTATPS